MTADQFEAEFKAMLEAAAKAVGKQLATDLEDVAKYARDRALHLATLVGDPEFEDAVLIERDNIALKAGIRASRTGDLADQRMLGVMHGAIRMGVMVIAAL